MTKRDEGFTGTLPLAAAQWSVIAAGAPWVISARAMQWWCSMALPQGKGDHGENQRMVSEKIAAAQESFLAVNTAVAQAMSDASLAMMTGKTPKDQTDTILAAGLKPYASRVRANRKRLSVG